jgi:hypothetical protein
LSCVSHLSQKITYVYEYEFDFKVTLEHYFVGDSFSFRIEFISDFYPREPDSKLPVLESKGKYIRCIVNLSRLGIKQYEWMNEQAVNLNANEFGFFILPVR